MLREFRAMFNELREDEDTVWDAFTLAFSSCITMRFFPYRTYLLIDENGQHYDPMPLKWNWRDRVLWQDTKEIERQKHKRV